MFERIGQDLHEGNGRVQVVAGNDDHQRTDAADAGLDAVEFADADVVVGQQVGEVGLDVLGQLGGEKPGKYRQYRGQRNYADVVVVDVANQALVADGHGGGLILGCTA